jgi:hypothetical protein
MEASNALVRGSQCMANANTYKEFGIVLGVCVQRRDIMPNWVNNTLEVSHSKEKIDALETFLDESKGEDFFDFFVEPATSDDWYQYNIENYGCKWNCNAFEWSRSDDKTLRIMFDSPWGPPIQLYENMLTGDYQVYAEYNECGMCFVGRFQDGVDESYEYSDLDSLKKIPDTLVESWGLEEQLAMWDE